MATPLLLPDMKESKKDALRPPAPEVGPKPEANGEPLAEAAVPEKPEVELSNLVTCSKLAQSQASLRSASSVGSVRGDEGGAYSEFFGDYAPLFDNRQDPDNISLQGLCCRCPVSGRGQGRCSAGTWRVRVARAVAVPIPAPGQGRAGPGWGRRVCRGWGPCLLRRDLVGCPMRHPPMPCPENYNLGGRAGNGCFHQFAPPNW